MLVYVDDILPASKSRELLDSVKHKLMKNFAVRDLGAATFFLGMEILRDRPNRSLKLVQGRLISEVIGKYGLTGAKTKTTPLSPGVRLATASSELELLNTVQFPYSELVGTLLYLSVCTRPDIAHAVGCLSRYMAKPTRDQWNAAMGVLRYLSGTARYGICFSPCDDPTPTVGFCDADYAGDIDTRRSTTGYVFVMHGGAVSWSSRLQPTVAVSTSEAEYMAAAAAVKEALWMRKLLHDLQIEIGSVLILSDNQACLSLLKHPIASQRSKHIDIIYHFARERVARGEVCFQYCPTAKMVADSLTKALPPSKFLFCRDQMGVSA